MLNTSVDVIWQDLLQVFWTREIFKLNQLFFSTHCKIHSSGCELAWGHHFSSVHWVDPFVTVFFLEDIWSYASSYVSESCLWHIFSFRRPPDVICVLLWCHLLHSALWAHSSVMHWSNRPQTGHRYRYPIYAISFQYSYLNFRTQLCYFSVKYMAGERSKLNKKLQKILLITMSKNS